MEWTYAIDLLGTLVFSISGVLTAIQKKFDLVGSAIIGLVTAVGGGALRDVLIGDTPVGWMKDLNYLLVIAVGIIISYIFKESILKLRKSMFLFDTLGIGLFTILGLEKTLGIGLSPIIAIMMGVVSAVFGGVIRDVLTGVVPLVFRREIYASACIAGGLVYLVMQQISVYKDFNMISSISVVFIIRYLSVKNKWSLSV